jgi:hypothetical protein
MMKNAFGPLLSTGNDSVQALWIGMRQAKASLVGILRFLAETHKISLLGDYQCLRPARGP